MKTTHERYKKLNDILGEGSYKTVTKAIDEEEGKEVAYNEVKIKVYEEETKTTSSFSKEIALLKDINHPYIIKIFDYWSTEENFVFITELMTGGTLKDYISKVGPLNTRLIKKWGKQILEGLKYLHTRDPPIIHRDIKNENIFVNSSQGEIKIGDLGIAKERKHKRYTIVGTPNFMAREMFEGEGYSEKVDIYAFGMSLIEMATGKPPYSEFVEGCDIYKNILRGVLPGALSEIQDGCLKSMIMCCLVPSNNRYSAEECLEHHFFSAENNCKGDCFSGECGMGFPLSESVPGMELSLLGREGSIITFQILVMKTFKFIKFDYNCENDSVEKVANELISENILDTASIDLFMELLDKGIKRALNSEENNGTGITPVVTQNAMKKLEFGEKTLEVMKEIEEEMLKKGANVCEEITLDEENINEGNETENNGKEDLSHKSVDISVYKSSDISVCKTNDNLTYKSSDNSKIIENLGTDEIILNDGYTTKSLSEEAPGFKLNCSEGYEGCKLKYQTNCPIAQFAYDAAAITGRSEETAKSWIRALKEDGIISVFDLKILVYEDWEKLSLTVFSARAMQNMLYGIDGIPIKERQLPISNDIKEYDNLMTIQEFLTDVCATIGRPDVSFIWENKLMSQDIRTVGELKSLHPDDWNRLGLSVYAYRILKNVIFRKGKIVY